MAKKKFDIKSTIAVQPKQFSVDDVESAIKKIHEEKAAAAQPERVLPTAVAAQVERTKPVAQKQVREVAPPPTRRGRPRNQEEPVRKVRLSIDVTPEVHKRLKIKAIEMDSDIMRYVGMLIEKDLAK